MQNEDIIQAYPTKWGVYHLSMPVFTLFLGETSGLGRRGAKGDCGVAAEAAFWRVRHGLGDGEWDCACARAARLLRTGDDGGEEGDGGILFSASSSACLRTNSGLEPLVDPHFRIRVNFKSWNQVTKVFKYECY